MGVLRGGLVIVLSVLLFTSLLGLNAFLILSTSLQYENVKENLYPVVKELTLATDAASQVVPQEFLGDLDLAAVAQQHYNNVKRYCQIQNNTQFYYFNYQGYEINISCSDVTDFNNVTEATESIVSETFSDVIYNIYYKQYECEGFWSCVTKAEAPFFLVSQKAQDYWQSKVYFALLASLILTALIFVLVERKPNTAIIAGVLLALSAFSLLFLKNIASSLAGEYSFLVDIFFVNTRLIFYLSLVIGILLAATGISLRVWMWKTGASKTEFSKQDVKEIVKQEIKEIRGSSQKSRQKKKR